MSRFRLDNPSKQKPSEKIHVTLGALGDKIEAMRLALVELRRKIVVNEEELKRLQEESEGTDTYRSELATQIKNDWETFKIASRKHIRAIGQYERKQSQLQRISRGKKVVWEDGK
ncbi:hypothetical protein A3C86_02225 [Candidatus Kaiserbacteria bacterium RIFCSPHIGHO2_02_FULL_49_16]|uniref:Uncharacterized protein n=2 Tax=Parcubacteria group TaxID=1794811 RepID=A0A0G1WFM5_9BACT|nr:MAG: hypothetical protein UY58_C0003G0012 [Candidatus Magasanikbacteria bacterium GW2011_GWA2_50_22]OGG58761.1 MAG: hypothetical protein A3C86_02225 [Candidatus Kaiserbacteria bacterium RIFCSPHIGHO2_02_FULL_49_16]